MTVLEVVAGRPSRCGPSRSCDCHPFRYGNAESDREAQNNDDAAEYGDNGRPLTQQEEAGGYAERWHQKCERCNLVDVMTLHQAIPN